MQVCLEKVPIPHLPEAGRQYGAVQSKNSESLGFLDDRLRMERTNQEVRFRLMICSKKRRQPSLKFIYFPTA